MEKGILPVARGWMEQTNKYIEIMDYIDGEVRNHIREEGAKNGR